MKGFYLFCIRSRIAEPIDAVQTIFGQGRIFVIPYKDIEAIASEVDLNEFDREEIQRKAQEDLGWIKEKAGLHEEIIEQAMGKDSDQLNSVIPMQFGVIFKTQESLEESLRNNYDKFRKGLDKLKEKYEWGVKVFLKEKILEKVIEDRKKIILAKKKKMKSMSRGAAFFVQKEIEGIASRAKDKELDRITTDVFESLARLASDKNQTKLLEKVFTGRREQMILNAFYLVEKSRLDQFRAKVQELKRKYSAWGLVIEMTGPWPSYHFVS